MSFIAWKQKFCADRKIAERLLRRNPDIAAMAMRAAFSKSDSKFWPGSEYLKKAQQEALRRLNETLLTQR